MRRKREKDDCRVGNACNMYRFIEQDIPMVEPLLLGVHSARLDLGNRDLVLDEALGLNCAWYADILTTLTKR
jgi:hypothetical protein